MTEEPLCEINLKSPLLQSSLSLPFTIRMEFDLQISSKPTPKALHTLSREALERVLSGT